MELESTLVINDVKTKVFHECDYCEGWSEMVSTFTFYESNICDVLIGSDTEKRKICSRCLIKAADKLLKI